MSSTVQDVLYALFKGRYSVEDLRESWQVKEVMGKVLHWGAVDDERWTVEYVDKDTGDLFLGTKEVSGTAVSKKAQTRLGVDAEGWATAYKENDMLFAFEV